MTIFRITWRLYAPRYNRNVPKVTFLPAEETFEFESGKLSYKDHGRPASLLDVAMNFGFHLEHACGGSCACTTCHVVVKQGQENLSEMEDDEMDRVEQAADYQLNSRLGCQAVVKGDVMVKFRTGTGTTSAKAISFFVGQSRGRGLRPVPIGLRPASGHETKVRQALSPVHLWTVRYGRRVRPMPLIFRI